MPRSNNRKRVKKIGIIGGAGYTAGQLLAILLNHPEVEIAFVHSSSHAGAPVADVHEHLLGDTDMVFSSTHPLNDIDLLFLCQAHGQSRDFWDKNIRPEGLRVIDLAQDFRDETDGYVYGLPEINRSRISTASSVANPGCFATAIQLSLLPLAVCGALPSSGDISITALTGSTGAGVKPSPTTHFSWRDGNISVYKPFRHQHLKEIWMNIRRFQPGCDATINFIPMRGDFARGIFAATMMRTPVSQQQLYAYFHYLYDDHPFVVVSDKEINLKQAVNTNKALIHIDKEGDTALVTCAIDNLLKGASGQAVQNMNIMFGFDERLGLGSR